MMIAYVVVSRYDDHTVLVAISKPNGKVVQEAKRFIVLVAEFILSIRCPVLPPLELRRRSRILSRGALCEGSLTYNDRDPSQAIPVEPYCR